MEKQPNGRLWKVLLLWLLVFTLHTFNSNGKDGIMYTQSSRQRVLGKTAQNDVTVRFTSLRSKLDCASLCLTKNGCTSFFYNTERRACMLISKQIFTWGTVVDEIHSRFYIVDCSFPPYQDGAMVDYTNTTFGAEANYLCVKGYSSSGTGNAVCLSNGSWSETDLVCSVLSHSTWQQVATTTASYTESDQRHDLQDRVSKTCKPKLRVKAEFNYWSRVTYISIHGVNSGVWGLTVGGLTKLSWDSFEASPEREFELFMSNEQSFYLFMKDNGNASVGTLDVNFTWFVQDDQCISKSRSSDHGSVLTSLYEGNVDPYFDTYHADESSGAVCGQRTVDVSHYGLPKFVTPPYWFINKDCSSGRQHILRWRLAGDFINIEPRDCSTSWCPDTCWHHVFDTRTSPANKDKYISHLVNGVLHGHNIMLRVEHTVTKAREVILQNGHVTVGVKEFWLPANTDAFSSGSLQAWMIASTTGRVVQCTHIPESPRVKEIKEDEKLTVWFLDSRQWEKVLSVDGAGTVLSGLRSALLNKVNEGRSLRVGVLFTNEMYKVLEVDFVDVSTTGQIAANVIHNADLVLEQGDKFSFSDTCRIVSSIITTEGRYKIYRYNIGAGGNHSIVTGVAKIEWFVEL